MSVGYPAARECQARWLR